MDEGRNEMTPEIQLISNLVVTRPDGRVLLVKYDPDDERLWLPGGDLEPYEHPDEAADRVLKTLPGLSVKGRELSFIESFRGRRGWHVVFHYRVTAAGEPGGELAAGWHEARALPPTAHRPWEQDSVTRALGGDR
jgi:ADP-ribose pyrophosphatase YjhB (NUDIX family)